MRMLAILRKRGEELEPGVIASLDHRDVTDQRDAFEVAPRITASVEAAAIERAYQAVIANQASHDNGVDRPLTEKGKHFGFVFARQRLNSQPPTRKGYYRRRCYC